MAIKAGVISIDVDLGTAKFLAESGAMNVRLAEIGDAARQSGVHLVTATGNASTGFQRLGKSAQEAGGHSVSSMQAASGSLRLLEGGFANNIRAAERFISTSSALSAALKTIFPAIGLIALAEIGVRGAENFGKLLGVLGNVSEAEKKAAEDAGKLNGEIQKLGESIAGIDAQKFAAMFGQETGKAKEAADTTSAAQTARSSLPIVQAGVAAQLERMQGLQETGRGPEELRRRDSGPELPDKGKEGLPLSHFVGGERQPLQTADEIQKALAALDAVAAKAGSGMSGSFRTALKQLEPLRLELTKAQLEADKLQSKGNLQSVQILTTSHVDYTKQTEEQAQNRLAELSNEEEHNQQLAASKRQKAEAQIAAEHAVRQAEIDGIEDSGQRAIASANEQVQVAKDRAIRIGAIDQQALAQHLANLQARVAPEGVGKNLPQQEGIQIKTSGKADQATGAAQQAAFKQFADEQAAEDKATEAEVIAQRGWAAEITRAWVTAFDVILKKRRETFEEQNLPAAFNILANQATDEVLAKGKGETDAKGIEGQKLRSEQTYALQPSHSNEQRVAQAKQIASFEAQARAANIAGVQQKLTLEAAAMEDSSAGSEKQVAAARQVGELYNQLALLRAESDNASIEAQTRILELIKRQDDHFQAMAILSQSLKDWKAIDLGTVQKDFASAAVQVPQAVGGSLATGIFDATGGHGADVGKQVGDAMKNLGKQLLGDLIADALKRILAELVLQTGLQTALNALLPAATAAGGVAGGAAGGGIAAAGSLAGGAASAAGSAASTAASGLVGPLISAAGGIIGGVISAVATWIGDNKIVKAVDGTTAAVNALADKFSGFGQTNTAGTLASTQSALTAQPGTTAQPGQSSTALLQSILGITPGSLTTTSLVQSLFGVTFGPGAAGGGLLKSIFGFGSGTQAIPVTVTSTSLAPTASNLNSSGTSAAPITNNNLPGGNIPILGGMLDSLMGKGSGGQQPVPVDIVSISPIAPLSGIFHMLGFADGGEPPTDRPSIIGERGPEIFWPKTAGAVIPNHQLKGFADGTHGAMLPDNFMQAAAFPSMDYMRAGASGGSAATTHIGDHNYSGGNHTFYISESGDARETARTVSEFLKRSSPKFSPFSK